MDSSIRDEIHRLIKDFTSEPAYAKSHMLSHESRSLFSRMQSELVNAQHIIGDVSFVEHGHDIDVSAAVSSLESFVQHASAAKDLQLILPNHLTAYQNRSLSIIKVLDESYRTAKPTEE